MSSQIIKSSLFLFLLLNPFLLIIYILDLVQDLNHKSFSKLLINAGLISFFVLSCFAYAGTSFFSGFLQVKFYSFQIFGGIVFLIISIRFIFLGNTAFKGIRGNPSSSSGSIAMPIMIGPGTVGGAVLAGENLVLPLASISIFSSIFFSVIIMIILKFVYDFVKPRNELIVERYIDIAGRIASLIIGTFSIEMIMSGITCWIS